MSDTDTPAESTAPAEETPPATAAPAFDVEAIKSELTASFEAKLNERIAGIQRSYQQQLNEKDAELREARLASMSDSEKARFEEDEGKAYLDSLERRVAIAEIGRKFPDIADSFEKLMGAETPEAQAEILQALRQAAVTAAPAAPAPEAGDEVPPVDPNNPAPPVGTPTQGRLPDGTPLTEEAAFAFLKALGDTPIGGYMNR